MHFYRLVFFFLPLTLIAHEIVAVGESIVDLIVQVDDAFIRDYVPAQKGGACALCSKETDRILKLCPTKPTHIPGGSAANTIRALAKLGVDCAFVSRAGSDVAGDLFVSNMQQYEVTDYILRLEREATKRVVCLITPDGQRTFIGPLVDPIQIAPPTDELIDAEWVHFEAWRLDGTSYVEESMQQAALRGANISFDLSTTFRVLQYKDLLLSLIRTYADLLFCNEDEATLLTGLPPQEACLYLQTLCPTVVITLGSQGCLVGSEGLVSSYPGFAACPIDTTGAGDHFAAGFLYGMMKRHPLSLCAHIGNRLGAAAVEVVGAQLPPESWREIGLFLKTF